jgi:hypothetical protein
MYIRRHFLTSLTVLFLLFAPQLSMKASAAGLTVDQCATAYSNTQKFINTLQSLFASKPWEPTAVADATKIFNALCPNFVIWPSNTIYECVVQDQPASAQSVSLNAAGQVINSSSVGQVICMTQNACTNIVSQRYVVVGNTATARCSSISDHTVVHLTDAQVQAAINATPLPR